eukprot:TRINITY_DN12619_c0_g2_i1.p1 TRINITY_DN12619_c0_g2~~TRINITY_DN12619_c0_g2_i1.p1  ORF type:complete len:975 (+),score=240.51 TRINITY_DN12619_c0_g2_i1:138-3062(+)
MAFVPRTRQYAAEAEKQRLPSEPVDQHPLQNDSGDVSTDAAPATPAQTFVDPLSQAADDPLSAPISDPLLNAVAQSMAGTEADRFKLDASFEPWEARTSSILSRYTTNEKLSIVSSFLGGGPNVTRVDGQDSVKARLEDLDDDGEETLQKTQDLSQQDYINRIGDLKKQLISAWKQDLRVRALKIVIQCAKMLSDIAVAKFYPSQFVLITDILDTFGQLVYDRLIFKSEYKVPGSSTTRKLPSDFTPDMVRQVVIQDAKLYIWQPGTSSCVSKASIIVSRALLRLLFQFVCWHPRCTFQVPRVTREICKNWFFKIASIRELLPRIYVEAALLRCRSFLSTSDIEEGLNRLSAQTRGIGDPLVCVYSRCYLARVGMSLMPHLRPYLLDMYRTSIKTFDMFGSDGVKALQASQELSRSTYLNLYVPALDWILQCVAYKADRANFDEVLGSCQKLEASSLLLNAIMSAFPPEYVAQGALQFIELIQASPKEGLSHHFLYRSLGMSLMFCPPEEKVRKDVLNQVWQSIGALESVEEYMSCAEVWVEYPAKYFSKREVNVLLGDILKHVLPEQQYENLFPQLQSVLEKILSNLSAMTDLFSMDNFMPFMDLFQKSTVRVDVCKSVLRAFEQHQSEPLDDTVTVNAMLYMAKTVHDSLTATSFDDDRRQITNLILAFVNKVDYGRQFEQMIGFYVDARSNFANLDRVLIALVHKVNRLMMSTSVIVKGQHTRRTAQFIRSCVSFTYITIPSIMSPLERLRLYIVSGTTALANQALAQADAFFTTCINFIMDVPPEMLIDGTLTSIEPELKDIISTLLSSLLLLPDDPELEPLSVLKSLLQAISDYPWLSTSTAQWELYTQALGLLQAYSQPRYLYSVENVAANDELYGNSNKFRSQVAKLANTLLKQLNEAVEAMQGDPTLSEKRALIASQVYQRLTIGCQKSEQLNEARAGFKNFAQSGVKAQAICQSVDAAQDNVLSL